MIAGEIIIKMMADLAELKSTVDKGASMVESAAKRMQGAFVGLAAGLTAGAFVTMVKDAIDAAEALKDLSTQTGMTVERLSALRDLGRLSSTSLESIVSVQNKLSKTLAVSNEESKGAGAAIKALGLDYQRFVALKPDDQLLELAKAMNQFEDGSGKSAVAMTLLGKEGAKMLPFLKDLAGAGELVATTTAEQAEMADRYNDAMEASRLRTEALQRSIAMALLPTLIELHDLTTSLGSTLGDYLRSGADSASKGFDGTRLAIGAVGTVMEALLVLGANVAFVFKGVGREVGGLAAQAAALARFDFAAVGAIRAEMVADAKAARQELDEFEKKVLGMTDRAAQAYKVLSEHGLSAAESANEIKRRFGGAGTAVLKFSAQSDDGAKAAAKLAEEGLKLANSLLLQDGGLSGDFLEKWAKLTAAYRAGAISLDVLQQAQARLLADQPAIKQHMKDVVDAANAAAEARRKESDEINRYVSEQQARVLHEAKAAEDAVEAAKLEYKTHGMLRSEIAMVTLERLRDKQAAFQAGSVGYEAAQREIDAQLELIGILQRGEVRDASEKAAKDAADAWKQTSDEISQALTNALMAGGKSGAEYVKGLLRTMVGRELMQVMSRGVNYLANAMGVGGGGGGLSGGAGGGLGGWASAGGAAFGAMGGMSDAAIGAGLESLYGTGSVTYMGSAELAAAGFGGEAAAAGGAAAAEGAAAGGMSGMATLGWVGLVAAVLYAIFSDHSKWSMGSVSEGLFGSDGKFGKTQFQLPYTFGNNTEHERDSKQMRAITDQFGGSLGDALRAFGADPAGLGLSISTDTDREGKAAGIISLLRDGRVIGGTQTGSGAFSGTSPGVDATKMDASQISQWMSSAMSEVIVQALKASDISQRFKDWFNAVADADMTSAKAQELLQVANAVKQLTDAFTPLGGVFSQLEGLSVDTFKALATATGGFDALGQSISSYYSNFYTEAERTQLAWDGITKTLNEAGISTVPRTRDEFRALVDSLNLSTDSGQEAFAALMKVQGAFVGLTASADDLAKATAEAAAAERKLWESRPDQPAMTAANIASAAAAELSWSQQLATQKMWADKLKDASFVGTLPANWQRHVGAGDWAEQLLPNALAVRQEVERQMQQLQDSELQARLSGNMGNRASGDAEPEWRKHQREAEQQQLEESRNLVTSLDRLRDSLESWRNGVLFGSASTLSPERQYALAQEQFSAINAAALAGDVDAAAKWEQAANRFLEESQAWFGGGTGFALDQQALLDAQAVLEQHLGEIAANTSASLAGTREQVALARQSAATAADGLAVAKQEAQRRVRG